MGNIICLDKITPRNPSSDILFYEVSPKVATPAPTLAPSSTLTPDEQQQQQQLANENENENENANKDENTTITSSDVDKRDNYRERSDSSSTLGFDVGRPPMTASSISSSTTISTMSTFNTANIEAADNILHREKENELLKEETYRIQEELSPEEQELKDEEESLDLLGISVYHLQHVFYPQCLNAGYDHNSKLYTLENLNNATRGFSSTSVIRGKTKNVFCPLDGQLGSSYVHSILHDMSSCTTASTFSSHPHSPTTSPISSPRTSTRTDSSSITDSGKKQYGKDDIQEHDHVGKATIMISYAWDYTIGDIIDTITSYCQTNGLDDTTTYIWMDVLCLNLHRIVDLKRKEFEKEKNNVNPNTDRPAGKNVDVASIYKSANELQETTQYRIQNIGHVLAIMSPYAQPTYLTRLWCMYELNIAYQLMNKSYHNNTFKGIHHHDIHNQNSPYCNITIAIPPTQKQLFMDDLEGNPISTINQLYDVVDYQIDIQSLSSTTVADDTTYILSLIQQSQPQQYQRHDTTNASVISNAASTIINNRRRYHGFNTLMKELFRGWVTHLIVSSVKEFTLTFMEEYYDDGRTVFNYDELKLKSNTFAEEELTTFYNQVAYAFRKNDENEHALDLYYKSLAIKEAIFDLDVDGRDKDQGNNNYFGMMSGNGNASAGSNGMSYMHKSKQKTAYTSLATTYNSVALVLQNLDKLDEALVMLRKCLAIREAVLSSKNLSTASTYNNIANVLHEQGEWVEALKMNTKCLETFETVLGPNHPSTATIYDSIASQLESMGNLDEAMVMYRKSLKIRESELGYHASTAISYGNIASLLEDTGEIEDALRMYKKCVKVQKVALGKSHRFTAATYNNIARILHSLGKKEEALTTWNMALGVLKDNIGPDHTQVLVQALVDKLGAK